ncbi:hypothetical protein B0H19DRAFT_1183363 [Mycena capillaripes]|nr:hypothetical protein B0H19DRAFT_1183363 [Mycena capillaripes]
MVNGARLLALRSFSLARSPHIHFAPPKLHSGKFFCPLAESGKSTIVKQMKIAHGGFDPCECAEYRMAIYHIVLDNAAKLARVVRELGLCSFVEDEREWAKTC